MMEIDGIYSIQKDEEMKRYYNYNISPWHLSIFNNKDFNHVMEINSSIHIS